MGRQKVIDNKAIEKRVRKIQRAVLKDAKRKLRRGTLSGEAFELYLPFITERYDHLRSELSTGHHGALARISGANAALLGEIENQINTLGADRHRLEQAYATAQKLAAAAKIARTDLPAEDKVTLDPLRERVARFKGSGTTEGAHRGA
ncbi:hypothetical protein L615_000800000340 [Nocardioides sp. J9]|uniref:hypothetical protein n=1 Tax=Nocardioides sp. J9 TaxID=935844 RepID=UPI0011A9BF3B|nr:hypothetical protein [Nocardioides sp. J9]TWG91524.1 hypothetical protein L615_000800000340 [Nocardioides sp. J9]